MSDLFNFDQQKKLKNKEQSSYTAKDIEVLEGLEPVRKRPGMYIGGTDITAMHHLVSEVLDNSMDEAVAGFANLISITVHNDNSITVTDNGRGIPVDNHPKFRNKSALEVILTTLHSGGKFSDNVYQTAGGLHGVGVSVVNALSEHLQVTVYKQGTAFTQTYAKGHPLTTLQTADAPKRLKGTAITFRPDQEIFGTSARFSPQKLYDLAKSKAYLYQGVEIEWECHPALINDSITPTKAIIHFPAGLKDYLSSKIDQDKIIAGNIFSGIHRVNKESIKLEWAIAWHDDTGFIKSYCNTIFTPLGGTHEQGIKTALLRGLKTYGEMVGNKKAQHIIIEDILDSACIIMSVFFKDPVFQGQTKEKLVSPSISKIIENIIKDHFDHWLSSNKAAATSLLEFIINTADLRINRKNEKNIARKTVIQKLRLPGKLADCIKETAQGTELFIVEGDSAGGSAKQARNRENQAVLPLRGKILNIANSTMDKIANNQEIQDLEIALACGSLKNFRIENLRYEKIIIMTDADIDGAHIASLLMTFFYFRMPKLITMGHLYIAQPPLYRLTQGSKTYYAANEEQKSILIKKLSKNSKSKIETGRFKGLGEMTPAQLKETTMHPEGRIMFRVNLQNQEEAFTIVNDLMGKKPEKRFEFIQNQALIKMGNIINNLDI
ncbi:DNA topoisomerase IV subunit B [Candidatus Trichorickettsia mobilis]|uniref:DNA topoisomerase IV subunit B n=1 Tax=Candidatus Trichorickettsia mobilis TaxID=1346319 RepID=UPI00292D9B5A|nr:DNA topoisomerase IV subunit B [Candidatus Trichorickettsia mobilis]